MTYYSFYASFLSIILLSLCVQAYASSPVSQVGSAAVDEGVSIIDLRAGLLQDNESDSGLNDQIRLRQHLDYAFTDSYALRLVVAQEDRAGASLEHSNVTIQNRFQLIEARDYGWNGGIRLVYTHNDGDKTPHQMDVRWLADIPFYDEWEWRHNIILRHDMGEDAQSGLLLELRNQVTRAVPPVLGLDSARLGLEMFNDFGRLRELSGYDRQDHQFGPVIMAGWDDYAFQLGYRTGISQDAPDHLFKLFVSRSF